VVGEGVVLMVCVVLVRLDSNLIVRLLWRF
jgi:hypothetical protein